MYLSELCPSLLLFLVSFCCLTLQQDEGHSRGFEILPERRAKVQTYVNLIEKGREKDKKRDDRRDSMTGTDEEVIYCLCRSSDCSTFMM